MSRMKTGKTKRAAVKSLARGRKKLSTTEQKKVRGGQLLTVDSQKLAESQALADKLRSRTSSPSEW